MEEPFGLRHGFLLDVASDGIGYLVEESPEFQTYIIDPTMFEGPVSEPGTLQGFRVVFSLKGGRPAGIRLSKSAASLKDAGSA